nr:cathepsin B-like [Leptinotarsa decemlineata]
MEIEYLGAWDASANVPPLTLAGFSFLNPDALVRVGRFHSVTTWTAGRNFDKHTPKSHIRNLLGAIKSPVPRSARNVVLHSKDTPIPESFDSRENWPNCQIIGVIKDQSSCGSCWAVAATSAMSDRICIHSNGKKQIYVSDEDLISCCSDCGYGCQGGYTIEAWNYWRETGLVSGGPYNSTTGCRAYSLAPCEHHTTGSKPACPKDISPTPRCNEQCDKQSSFSYQSDKSYGQNSYYVGVLDEQIQLEILKNGPVEAAFIVYTDFITYKSGTYSFDQTRSYICYPAVALQTTSHSKGLRLPYPLVGIIVI